LALVLRKFDPNLRQIKRSKMLTLMIGSHLWMAFFLYLPHKEERFMFVIYPLICVMGSISLVLLGNFLQALLGATLFTRVSNPPSPPSPKPSRSVQFEGKGLTFDLKLAKTFLSKAPRYLLLIVCASSVALSCSRTVSSHINYHAPIEVYTQLSVKEFQSGLNDQVPLPGEINVCVGKEWYRFPSNFFMPSERFKLQYIESGFTGQLPQPYVSENGTWIIPSGFNALNKQEMSRYVC